MLGVCKDRAVTDRRYSDLVAGFGEANSRVSPESDEGGCPKVLDLVREWAC
jgi:hypothetical protein